jgi:hypothetical protein
MWVVNAEKCEYHACFLPKNVNIKKLFTLKLIRNIIISSNVLFLDAKSGLNYNVQRPELNPHYIYNKTITLTNNVIRTKILAILLPRRAVIRYYQVCWRPLKAVDFFLIG